MNRPTATQILLLEHGNIRRVLNSMEKVLNPPDVSAIGRLMDDLTTLLSRHARKEEEIFFPELRDMGVTLSEHGKEVLVLAEVEIRVAYAVTSLSAAQVLAEACRKMIDDLREHLVYEERFIFPDAEKGLSVERLRELGDHMEAIFVSGEQPIGV